MNKEDRIKIVNDQIEIDIDRLKCIDLAIRDFETDTFEVKRKQAIKERDEDREFFKTLTKEEKKDADRPLTDKEIDQFVSDDREEDFWDLTDLKYEKDQILKRIDKYKALGKLEDLKELSDQLSSMIIESLYEEIQALNE